MTSSSASPARAGFASPDAMALLTLPDFGATPPGLGAAEPWMPAELPAPRPSEVVHPDAVIDPAMLERVRRMAADEEVARAAQAAIEEEASARRQALEDAYALGYSDGVAAGRDDEMARLRNALACAESALDQLRATESRWRDRMQENVCAVAVTVARELIGRELRTDADGLGALVRLALSEFPSDLPVTIRISPEDLATITAAAVEGQSSSVTAGREARWVADPSLLPAGCVVEGRDRIIDGRVDTALERMYRQLTQTHA